MSNYLAIATVTSTLKGLLVAGIGEAVGGATLATIRPGDQGLPDPGIGLFLYQVRPNAALRNVDLPNRDSDGRVVQRPQAALDLFYLLSFYGDETEQVPQQLLGYAVKVLHDQPLLTRADIRATIVAAAPGTWLRDSDLAEQVEKVKFSPFPLDMEELSKLWSIFADTKYFLSVVYQASVVLIESDRPVKSPLPVLTRGPGDEGVITQPHLVIPLPTLETVQPPNNQPRAMLGDTLTITGHHLEYENATVNVIFENARHNVHRSITADSYTATSITVTLTDGDPDEWAAGVYTVWAEVKLPDEDSPRITNALSMLLAPRIDSMLASQSLPYTLTLEFNPPVRSGPVQFNSIPTLRLRAARSLPTR